MDPFTLNQWLIVGLVFLLGLILGMSVLAGGKWKRRYKEEVKLHAEERKRREALETDRKHWEAQTLAARAREDRV